MATPPQDQTLVGHPAWRDELFGRESYLPVLLLALLLLAMATLGSSVVGVRVTVPIVAALLVAMASRRALMHRVVRRAVDVAAGAVALASALSAFIDPLLESDVALTVSNALLAVLFLLAMPATLKRAFTMRRVGPNALAAAVSAYVMFGLFFASTMAVAGSIESGFFAQAGTPEATDYAYFSFITLTTVGFGDLTPGNGTARTLAVLEALLGQIFLVVIVARVVSTFGMTREIVDGRLEARPDAEPAADDSPGEPDGI